MRLRPTVTCSRVSAAAEARSVTALVMERPKARKPPCAESCAAM
jgi:hypothetical protein